MSSGKSRHVKELFDPYGKSEIGSRLDAHAAPYVSFCGMHVERAL